MENKITSLGRLTSCVDCGTIHGERKVNIGFQLVDIDVEPQDKTLPIYKQFAKTPYGGNIIVGSDLFNSICDGIGCERSVEGLISSVGKMYNIEYHTEDYRGKPMYIVDSVSTSTAIPDGIVSWGVETRSFIFSDSTTKADVDALGFDSKHVRSSNEYCKIIENLMLDDSIIF